MKRFVELCVELFFEGGEYGDMEVTCYVNSNSMCDVLMLSADQPAIVDRVGS